MGMKWLIDYYLTGIPGTTDTDNENFFLQTTT